MRILNILTRRLVPESEFNETVQFYQNLIGQTARLAFDYPEYDLKLAQVGSLLFIGGTPEGLAPFQVTQVTFLVSDIYSWEKSLPAMGAVILKPVKIVPTGWNMLVRHPDGMQVEYVEHKTKNPDDDIF
ncbi:VOC family protein [Salmonella enterica]|nr:VOC family protein [Salmonella enterica]EFU0079309.1 VOC family protein [Salmonella enterica]EGN1953423.1 VOC family protein [Salmonella enterica]EGZ4893587.1 VOC family protein [Salmonella enterica]EIV4724230.1 VOC family protein [Salmonella enterica]